MPILCGESNQVAVTQNGTDLNYFSSLLLPAAEDAHSGEEAETCGGHNGDDEAVNEALIMDGQTDSSPQSEAAANELQELSLQHGAIIQNSMEISNAAPLSERKNVLQLKLQQRRTREELVNQGIMPPLKSPASFHEQRRSLERARTEDYLKRKIRCRPQRSELVRMHILEETSAEPSLQAKQLKLKRARLADDLNEKISQRPGPMELVVKNILPVENSLKEAIIDGDYSKVAESSSFDEDSSDALSPEQPASQDSQGSVPSPGDSRASEAGILFSPTQTLTCVQLVPEFIEKSLISDISQSTPLNISNGLSFSSSKALPALKQGQSKPFPEKSLRTKKTKEPKPKVKKLKYHQYIPPDQKQKGTPAMDSSYAKILQQQQLFLQLQILNQQQHQHYNYHTILPAPPKPLPEQTAVISSSPAVLPMPSIGTSSSTIPPVVRQNSNVMTLTTKTVRLPHNLDDMKVAELKQELKHRGLHVSGTKVDLIERLKATQDLNICSSTPLKSTANQPHKPNETVPVVLNATSATTESTKLGSFSSTPPCSPCLSEVSMTSVEEAATTGDPFGETVLSPVSPLNALPFSPPFNEKSPPDASDKDIMLREKDRQIEELTQRLKQKQALVEKLRQQLEQEKKTQQLQQYYDEQTASAEETQVHIKGSANTKSVIKSELKMLATCQQEQKVFINAMSKVNEGKMQGSSAAQIVFKLNGPNNLHSNNRQQVVLQVTAVSTPLQHQDSKTDVIHAQPKRQGLSPDVQLGPDTVLALTISSDTEPLLNKASTQRMPCNSFKENPLSCLQKQVDPQSTPLQPKAEPPQQCIFLATSSTDWIKEVPDLEDSLAEESSAAQDASGVGLKVDDFFDVLMNNLDLDTTSKEFPVPCLKQSSSTHASENVATQRQITSLPSSTTLGRLEDFLETSTGTQILQGDQDVTPSLPLIDDLHNQMLSSLAILDHPNSAMDTSDLHFSSRGEPLGLDMTEAALDGMDWLELSEPPAMNLTPLSTTTPSVFCTDFLDSHDLQLHWDSCL